MSQTTVNIASKIKRYLWRKLIQKSRDSSFYYWLYQSYWRSLIYKNNSGQRTIAYFSALPNPGAGIGHQLANWIAGYWFANSFNLQFAHLPFSSEKWEHFLGFGENEITVEELVHHRNYKKVKLPLFDENNPNEIERIKKIINSYANQRVIFIAEQDQFYRDQFGVREHIKKKFYEASARENDQLIYSSDCFNIAIHVRRGDIVTGRNKLENHRMRWQDNTYFEKVLGNVIDHLTTDKEIAIYLFSQGAADDFKDFEKFPNLHFCLEMNAQDSFLHMVNADLLITSKSSFSYKPALLSNGIKVCPKDFWHGYPDSVDWIMADENGNLLVDKLISH